MTDFHQFVAAAVLLLIIPGPTNTLLATAAALEGVRAWRLVSAEVAGYGLSIGALETLVAPVAASGPAAFVLRLICALYLAWTAVRLWRSAMRERERVITWPGVFLATICNPKTLVFAFILLPPRAVGLAAMLDPYGVTLLVLIVLAGTAWVAAGSVLHERALGAPLLRRASSVVIGAFSAIVMISLAAPRS